MTPARILVVGVMRSGKSTVASALGRLEGVEVVEEPDNPLSRPFAFRVKRGLGQRYRPLLSPGEQAPEYELLWQHAFGAASAGARRFSTRERAAARRLEASPRRRWQCCPAGRFGVPGAPVGWRLHVVRWLAVPERPQRTTPHVLVTANEPLAAEWVAEQLDAAVVVVVRDPLAVLSSWTQLGWLGRTGHDMLDGLDPRAAAAGAEAVGVPVPAPGSRPLVRAAWLAGLLTWHLRAAAQRNPAWKVVSFQRLMEQPVERLRELAEALGLTWRDGAADGLFARLPASPWEELDAVRPQPGADELAEARALLAAFSASPRHTAHRDCCLDWASDGSRRHTPCGGRHAGLRRRRSGRARHLATGAEVGRELPGSLLVAAHRPGGALERCDVAVVLALRNIKSRYKQTFGAGWAILQPLAGVAIFSVVLGRLAQVPSEGIPYPVFVFAGLVLWGYFTASANAATDSLAGYRQLITKVYFPAAAPLAAVIPPLLDVGVQLVVVAIFMGIWGVAPTYAIVLLPFWVLATIVFSFGVGAWLAALNVKYRDVRNAITFLLQVWFFATPVAYGSSLLPSALIAVNPMAGLVDGFRWSLIGAPPRSRGRRFAHRWALGRARGLGLLRPRGALLRGRDLRAAVRAIEVESVGKKYRIGTQYHLTLRESS